MPQPSLSRTKLKRGVTALSRVLSDNTARQDQFLMRKLSVFDSEYYNSIFEAVEGPGKLRLGYNQQPREQTELSLSSGSASPDDLKRHSTVKGRGLQGSD